ncbi:HAMP domain-containing protein [bacterium]|nr:HAMP domain-containing protein [bacterium]
MRTRFPIYTKVLIFFTLNLVLVGGAILFVMRTQLSGEMDNLLGRAVAVRIIDICEELRDEVQRKGLSTWDEALAKAKSKYNVDFYLFYVKTWEQAAGEPIALPEAAKAEFRGPRGPDGPLANSNPNAPTNGLARPRPGPRPPVDRIVLAKTEAPTSYWFGMRMPVRMEGKAGPGVLYARTHSLFGSGLLIDLRPWLFLGIGIFAGSALLWLPLVRDLTASVKQMTSAAEKIAAGNFDIEVNDQRRDELGRLGGAINRMSHRLADFVDGQKRFLGDTAHELTAPLARMQLALSILEQRADPDAQEYVQGVYEELQLMTNLVNELLSLTKAGLSHEAIQLDRVELLPLIRQVVARECKDDTTIKVDVSEEVSVLGEADLLARALANIIRNSIRYGGDHNAITVRAKENEHHVTVSVEDTGPGVPDDDLSRLFDPFYRVDRVRTPGQGGAGLGLAIVQTCVTACGGSVSAENGRPHGLRLNLSLPIATPESS